jgi:hypothetical protein
VPNNPDTWISVLQVGVSIVGVAITVWLALIVNRSAAKITEVEISRALRDSWIHVDDVTLRDPALIKLAQHFQPPHESTDPQFEQKRLFLFVYLNPLNTTYQAARQGLFGKAGSQAAIADIKNLLAYVVRDDDAFWVIQNHWFDAGFKGLCNEMRESLT